MKIGYLDSIIQNIPIKKACKGYYLRWYYNGWHYWFFLPGETNIITEGESYRTIGTRMVAMGSGEISYNQVRAIRTILLTREVYILTSDGWRNIRVNQASVITYKNQINGYEIEIITTIGSREISPTGYSPIDVIPEVTPGDPGFDECIIGSLIWDNKNYDSAYPNFMSYDMTIENKETYGCLYTYTMIMSPGFVLEGWHIPTLAEWQSLITETGGTALAGGKLKEAGTDHWNTDTTVPPVSCFEALGGGLGNPARKSTGLKLSGNFWTATLYDATHAYYIKMVHDVATVQILTITTGYYLSIRLVKDTAPTFIDWFLPSRDEMKEMFAILTPLIGFTGDYWTSSETVGDPDINACWNDDDDWEEEGPKGDTHKVRACRSFVAGVGAYSLGDIGPVGGWIFYIDGAGTTYYEAAPSDQSIAYIWSNITNIEVGTGTAIGTGSNNTDLIIAQPGHTDSAAKLCKDLVI